MRGSVSTFYCPNQISISQYFTEYSHLNLIDVRSPAEYDKGHIVGAVNLPLFSDDERGVIGTLYKQQGKSKALQRGFEIVAPRMKYLSDQIIDLSNGYKNIDGGLAIYCWRGGLRSRSLCWLAGQRGIKAYQIIGGYKYYRRHMYEAFENIAQTFFIVGGKTGTGKTKILHELRARGEQIIDLEHLADHKGSAFGFIDENEQATVEHFENKLYSSLAKLNEDHVWIENESKSIGRVFIPSGFWTKMKKSKLIHIEMEINRRADHLVEIYGSSNRDKIKFGFSKIKKKLGDLRYKQALQFIDDGDLKSAAIEALKYYDKAYLYGLENSISPDISIINAEHYNFEELTDQLIHHVNNRP